MLELVADSRRVVADLEAVGHVEGRAALEARRLRCRSRHVRGRPRRSRPRWKLVEDLRQPDGRGQLRQLFAQGRARQAGHRSRRHRWPQHCRSVALALSGEELGGAGQRVEGGEIGGPVVVGSAVPVAGEMEGRLEPGREHECRAPQQCTGELVTISEEVFRVMNQVERPVLGQHRRADRVEVAPLGGEIALDQDLDRRLQAQGDARRHRHGGGFEIFGEGRHLGILCSLGRYPQDDVGLPDRAQRGIGRLALREVVALVDGSDARVGGPPTSAAVGPAVLPQPVVEVLFHSAPAPSGGRDQDLVDQRGRRVGVIAADHPGRRFTRRQTNRQGVAVVAIGRPVEDDSLPPEVHRKVREALRQPFFDREEPRFDHHIAGDVGPDDQLDPVVMGHDPALEGTLEHLLRQLGGFRRHPDGEASRLIRRLRKDERRRDEQPTEREESEHGRHCSRRHPGAGSFSDLRSEKNVGGFRRGRRIPRRRDPYPQFDLLMIRYILDPVPPSRSLYRERNPP